MAISSIGWDAGLVGVRLRALSRLMTKSLVDAPAGSPETLVDEMYLAADIMVTLADQLAAIETSAQMKGGQFELEERR